MNRNFQKEEEFYANNKFCFSYSSLNKLLFSPFLFYKDYILKDNETDPECDCMVDVDKPLEEWHNSFIDSLSVSEKEKFFKNPNEYGR